MLERARRLGGTLEIGARAGGGTRVRLAFPDRARPCRRCRGRPLMAAPRIVLVDDHALCRNGLTDLLQHRGGMEVLAALSATPSRCCRCCANSSPTWWCWTCACRPSTA